ncbi:DUF397 domain-containing protein [Streptomyces griseocarneus]|uniref:DUF397 domain-containing protein n=1 Tax=Streptomyces griseocarneus TaxID=51201 RepID=UPI00167CE2D4|nr:DUF397 domain-containing protein [Streptomyces griseocarneus]MBZ6476827.1 DUF397 domain-containing protein [Streptomyces griseocarneus]GHG81202.1 hypothetical protein GCM10018779_63240 [Streptomyces griseocarneus]
MNTNHGTIWSELAEEARWFKSSHSIDDGGGSCVTVATLADLVGVRDSKRDNSPALVVPRAAWNSFVHVLRFVDPEVGDA